MCLTWICDETKILVLIDNLAPWLARTDVGIAADFHAVMQFEASLRLLASWIEVNMAKLLWNG